MTIEDLKLKLINKETLYPFMILKNSENTFIANQYINEIARLLNTSIEYIDNLDYFYNKDPFSSSTIDALYVYNTNDLCLGLKGLEQNNNLIITCSKVNKGFNSWYNDYIINIPKLEEWQIKDYVYSTVDGIDTNDLDWLIDICNKDIYRIDLELDKLRLFGITERQVMFNKFKQEGVYSDLNNNTLFTLINAIARHDLPSIGMMYKSIDTLDFNPIGFVQLLYNNFRNIILVQLSRYATAEKVGLKTNQFNAIKWHSIGFYTKEQLLAIFEMLTGIDKRIKTGMLDASLVLDYVITFILSV